MKSAPNSGSGDFASSSSISGAVYDNINADEPSPSQLSQSQTSTFRNGKSLDLTNRLPPEVLLEIFYWCIPLASDKDYSSPRFSLTLSQVCSYWRTIALDSPRLWTYTKIEVINQALSPALKLLRLYLLRSNMCNVFIDVDFLPATAYSAQFSNPVLHLFEEIVNVARQYRPAYILEDSVLVTHLEASSTERQPTREEWYFWSARTAKPSSQSSVLSGSSSDSDMQLVGTSHTTPDPPPSVTIRALRLAVGAFTLEPYFSWASSLTFLILKDYNNFTNLTPNKAAHILRTFPLLVHCSVHIDYADVHVLPDDAEQGEPVELIYLKSLAISWAVWVDSGPLIDALHTPALKELELVGRLPDTEDMGNWLHLSRFLQRNRPPLSHLILEQFDCFHAPLLQALSWAPNLKGLWLEDCLLNDTIIRGLYFGGNGVLRTLSTLVFLECYWVDIEVLALVLKEHASANGGNPSVKVHVNSCGVVNPAHIRLLEEMNITNIEFGGKDTSLDIGKLSRMIVL
ncbi:hypothetical protein EW145_g7035 [Phellinidium pouzarii]|uniref:F-box domain-containing protein n=1 Tax=Phellinidium pouzarii TaxID=167371 RepID=A0A4S4KRX7_9AGAM|nr:hypothetical protein EW145_g7035 [Phellinidium pouzarii]